MTKDKIKKALELCTNDEDCEKCPYCDTGCTRKLRKDSFTLITEQEQEIAELKAAKNDWKQRYESLDQRYIALVASSVECIDKKVKKAKTDVLNELKSLSIYDFNYMDSYVLVDDIDKMIAEVEQCRR